MTLRDYQNVLKNKCDTNVVRLATDLGRMRKASSPDLEDIPTLGETIQALLVNWSRTLKQSKHKNVWEKGRNRGTSLVLTMETYAHII